METAVTQSEKPRIKSLELGQFSVNRGEKMDSRMSMSDLMRMEFKQAFEEFDKVVVFMGVDNVVWFGGVRQGSLVARGSTM